MIQDTKSILPIVSGGLDSTTLLWYLRSKNYNISEIISFQYGQKHGKEIEYASKIAQIFSKRFNQISHKIVNISNIGNLIASGALTGDEEVPHDMYDSNNQRLTIVPNRNMILISIAAGRAVTLGLDEIGYAAHASDYSVYPDCRPEFVKALDNALYLGNLWQPIHLSAPFMNKSKIEIVKLGLVLKVPYELTWSCYEGSTRPCLQCGTCIERTEAFQENNIPDPALSKKEWSLAVKYLHQYKK